MRRSNSLLALVGIAAVATVVAADSRPEPTLYELAINGESFTIEPNRSLKLHSKQKPGVVYDVALRVAQVQRIALNNLQLDYDRGYEISDDPAENVRTVTLKHELGFTVVVSDLGGPMDEPGRRQVLARLQKSMEQSFREDQTEHLKTAARHERRFTHAPAEGVTIQYHDARGRAHSCLIYVLAGKTFTASAIAQFQDADHQTVLPLVKKTLDSIGPR
jgi:hypothetical protein